MSHAVAIGVDAPADQTCDVLSALTAAGLSAISSIDLSSAGGVLAELVAKANQVGPSFHWFLAVCEDDADLDFIYKLSDSLREGALRAFVDAVTRAAVPAGVGVLIYDLAETELCIEAPQPLERLPLVLGEAYHYGGPMGSVFHEFRAGESASS